MKVLEITDNVLFFITIATVALILMFSIRRNESAINKVDESQQAESTRYIIIRENGFECIPPCEFPRDSLFFQLSSEKK